jgi:hypothetical protein
MRRRGAKTSANDPLVTFADSAPEGEQLPHSQTSDLFLYAADAFLSHPR